jgi:hypothetical protein
MPSVPLEQPFNTPYDKPFDKLTVLSQIEGLTVLSQTLSTVEGSKVEGPHILNICHGAAPAATCPPSAALQALAGGSRAAPRPVSTRDRPRERDLLFAATGEAGLV